MNHGTVFLRYRVKIRNTKGNYNPLIGLELET